MSGDLLYRIPFLDYCEFEGVNISSLKAMRRSPAHFLEAAASNKRPSPAMRKGSATHCAVFEPARFVEDYLRHTEPRLDKRTKAFKELVEANPFKEILGQSEYDAVIALRDAVRAHPVAVELLAEGRPEVSMIWTDDETGIDCKGREDWITPSGTLVGLKTAARADPWAFARQSAQLGYHLQWAYYADGYEAIMGHAPTSVIEIVVETERPYDVVPYRIGADTIAQGREEYRALLRRLRDCVEADHWPGTTVDMIDFELPAWAINDVETVLTIGGQEVSL